MLAAVFGHIGLVLALQMLHQRNVVIGNVILANGTDVEHHLDYLVLRVAVEMLVLHV